MVMHGVTPLRRGCSLQTDSRRGEDIVTALSGVCRDIGHRLIDIIETTLHEKGY